MPPPLPFIVDCQDLVDNVNVSADLVDDLEALTHAAALDAKRAAELAKDGDSPALRELAARFRVLAFASATILMRAEIHNDAAHELTNPPEGPDGKPTEAKP